MDTRSKGRKAELEYSLILESEGYLVERVKGAVKFSKSVDFFGIADLIAIGADGVRLIQVKSNGSCGAIKKLARWKIENESKLPPGLRLFVVARFDGNSKRKPYWKTWEIGEIQAIN